MFAFVIHDLESDLDRIIVSELPAELSQGLTLKASREALRDIPTHSTTYIRSSQGRWLAEPAIGAGSVIVPISMHLNKIHY